MKRLFFFVPVLLFYALSSMPAQAADKLPQELNAVPGNALFVARIRMADLWKSESLAPLRDRVLKAGTTLLDSFDKRFIPSPSSLDRLTLILLPGAKGLNDLQFVGLMTTTKKMVAETILKVNFPDAKIRITNGKTYYYSPRFAISLAFLSEQMVAVGEEAGIREFLANKEPASGPLLEGLNWSNSDRHISIILNLSAKEVKSIPIIPEPVRPILKSKLALLGMNFSNKFEAEAQLLFPNEQDAQDCEAALKKLALTGRDQLKSFKNEMTAKVIGQGTPAPFTALPEAVGALYVLGFLDDLDAFLSQPPLVRHGKNLNLAMKFSTYDSFMGIAIGLLLPAVQKVRLAGSRTVSMNNVKQIMLAMHNYHDVNGTLPPVANCDKNGKPLLSWRVHLLPYLEQQNLYNQFHLNEPWDSEHNIKLSKMLVKVYVDPLAPQSSSQPGLCHYRVFYGKGTALGLQKSESLVSIKDGTSRTWLVVEADEGVPWTKPEEFLYDPKKPLPKMADFTSSGFLVGYADGSVRLIPNTISEKTFRGFLTIDGGELDDLDK